MHRLHLQNVSVCLHHYFFAAVRSHITNHKPMSNGPFDDWTDQEWKVYMETFPSKGKEHDPDAYQYLAYIRERDAKEKFWLKYAKGLLDKKKVTRSELEGAAIGVGSFDREANSRNP